MLAIGDKSFFYPFLLFEHLQIEKQIQLQSLPGVATTLVRQAWGNGTQWEFTDLEKSDMYVCLFFLNNLFWQIWQSISCSNCWCFNFIFHSLWLFRLVLVFFRKYAHALAIEYIVTARRAFGSEKDITTKLPTRWLLSRECLLTLHSSF